MEAVEISRPKTVKLAVLALAATIIAGLFRAVFGTDLSSVPLDPLVFYGMLFGSSTLGALVLYKIWTRNNWARVIYAFLFGLGLLKAVPALIFLLQISVVTGLWSAALVSVKGTAVALLFFPASNRWFCHSRL